MRLAARLAGAPRRRPLAVVYFTSSGAEAIEGALKTARKHTGRPRFVAFEGGFHGDTFGALSVGGNPVYRAPFEPLLPDVTFLPVRRRGGARRDRRAHRRGRGRAGPGRGRRARPRRPAFLPALRRRCDATGALLVLDEVVTGFGRTGRLFAHEHWGVRARPARPREGARRRAPARRLRRPPDRDGDARARPAARPRHDLRRPPACRAPRGWRRSMCWCATISPSAPPSLGARLLAGLAGLVGRGGLAAVRGLGLLLGLEFEAAGRVRPLRRPGLRARPHPQLDAPPRHGRPSRAAARPQRRRGGARSRHHRPRPRLGRPRRFITLTAPAASSIAGSRFSASNPRRPLRRSLSQGEGTHGARDAVPRGSAGRRPGHPALCVTLGAAASPSAAAVPDLRARQADQHQHVHELDRGAELLEERQPRLRRRPRRRTSPPRTTSSATTARNAYWDAGAAGEVANEIVNATNGGADGGGNRCARTYAQGGTFWVIGHSMAGPIMDFILGNNDASDPNFNFNGPYDQVAQRVSLVDHARRRAPRLAGRRRRLRQRQLLLQLHRASSSRAATRRPTGCAAPTTSRCGRSRTRRRATST